MYTAVELVNFKQEDTNLRANKMWRQISQKIDFREKIVLDIGCGYGDFTWRSFMAGAHKVFAWDQTKKFRTDCPHIIFIDGDANVLKDKYRFLPEPDIVICFSLLPYLKDHDKFLQWISQFQETLLEFQYVPEPYNIGISNDDEAQILLEKYWSGVEKIGETEVSIRNTTRTIWNCYGGWS